MVFVYTFYSNCTRGCGYRKDSDVSSIESWEDSWQIGGIF